MTDFRDIFGSRLLLSCRVNLRGRPIAGLIGWLKGLSMLGGQLSSDANPGSPPDILTGAIDGHDAWRSDVAQFWEGPDGFIGLNIQTGDRFSVWAVMRRVGAAPGSDAIPWTVSGSSFLPLSFVKFKSNGKCTYNLHYDDGGSGAQAESAEVTLDSNFHLHELHMDEAIGHGAFDGVEITIPTGGAGAGAQYALPPPYAGLIWGDASDIFALGIGTPHDFTEIHVVLGSVTVGEKAAARSILRGLYPSIGIA